MTLSHKRWTNQQTNYNPSAKLTIKYPGDFPYHHYLYTARLLPGSIISIIRSYKNNMSYLPADGVLRWLLDGGRFDDDVINDDPPRSRVTVEDDIGRSIDEDLACNGLLYDPLHLINFRSNLRIVDTEVDSYIIQ